MNKDYELMYDDLLRRIKEAVEEMKDECENLFPRDAQVVAMDLYILSKHIPELED